LNIYIPKLENIGTNNTNAVKDYEN
jgi:hypothetical protein